MKQKERTKREMEIIEKVLQDLSEDRQDEHHHLKFENKTKIFFV